MDLGLTGCRAVVTGGTRGLGLVIARVLAEEGVSVAILGRSTEAVASAAAALGAGGAAVYGVAADVTDDAALAQAGMEAIERLGGVDVLVNNAALPASYAGRAGVMDFDDRAVIDDFNTKAIGYLRMIRAVAPSMRAQGHGRIVNIGGLAARATGFLATSMRNAAVVAMTKNAADELGPFGITVNSLHPGVVPTDEARTRWATEAGRDGRTLQEIEAALAAQYAAQRLMEPVEVARIVAFLASPLCRAISGESIACAGSVLGPISY